MEYPWRSKLRRSGEHLKTFERECANYLDDANVGFTFDVDPEAGRLTVRLRSDADPPMLLGAVVGDVLHNLRSALDAIAWAACQRAGVEPQLESKIYFPIGTKPSGWPELATRQLPGLGAAAVRVFEELQPWYYDQVARGNDIPVDESVALHHPLARLHDLARKDRHRVPHPLLARAGHTWIGSPEGVSIELEPADSPPWTAGKAVVSWRISPASRTHDVRPAGRPILAFSEESALLEHSALSELQAMQQSVAYALRRVELEVLELVSTSELDGLTTLQRAVMDLEEELAKFRHSHQVIDDEYIKQHGRISDRLDQARRAYDQKWREYFD